MATRKKSGPPNVFTIWAVLMSLVLVVVLGVAASRPKRKQAKPKDNGVRAAIENLKRLQQHPASKAAFDAGYQYGAKRKASGLSKQTERELEAYAWPKFQSVEMPDDVRGQAMKKFKDGYGLGYLNGR
jgi:hypothetical protein